MRLHQQFGHRDGGGHSAMARLLEPRKDVIGEYHVPGIGFQLTDEDARIKCNSLMTAQKGAQAGHSQLLRSLRR